MAYGLGPAEAELFETLLKRKDKIIRVEEISDIILSEYGVIMPPETLRVHICHINKKVKGAIINRRCYGYYVNENIEIKE